MTILFAILILITILASIYASYLYGLNQMKSRWLVEAKRRNKTLVYERNLWQNAYVRAKGGELKPKPPREPSDAKQKRIVAPSEVISELKEKPATTVPKAIETKFLEDAKQFAR